MGLTALAIKSAKGADKKYKMNDAGGLYLLVMPSGRRYWRLNYRFADKHKTLAFGVYPQVSLAEARAKRDEAQKLLAKRIDPLEQQRLDRIVESIAAATLATIRSILSFSAGSTPAAKTRRASSRLVLASASATSGQTPNARVLHLPR